MKEWLLPLILAAVGSTGLFGLVQFLISRKDSKKDRLTKIENSVNLIAQDLAEEKALIARSDILRFDDDLINGRTHSKEYFRAVLSQIDTYDKYTREHEDFKNSYTVEAEAHIREVYRAVYEKIGGAPNETIKQSI